jgi:hypothetical protein
VYGRVRYAGREGQANQGLERGDFKNVISQADTDLKIIAKNHRTDKKILVTTCL